MKYFTNIKKMFFIGMMTVSYQVLALLPRAPSELTDHSNDWVKGLMAFLAPYLSLGMLVVTGAGAVTMISAAWESFDQARKHGDWKSFGGCLTVGLVLLGLTVFIVTKFKDILSQ